ncbi:acyltransferase [Yersinia alsatica]|uniref:Acyltransferase n=1 Tax=Yersinia alsatica TaxID=2890317 RepID=A0ABY5UJE4_9GAMM|nr:acyltransferase family protein [Yersinia alsatica]OWF69054.1 acyltransferase [Yersinia frederiksenii]UWM43586.1 acyltransferase [Yersinia alsatica]CNK68876.1 acyltransferase family protein [Yersinia frederiksenii]CNL53259.1 acyltransferase family protein [Yersinia frederiksenii]
MLATTPTQKIASNKFRNDINGLRAWAVIAVVLYHFGVPGFSGGFVGVDIFFVISGFLMTRIIVSGMESGNFSFLQFYLARARRIIPMLLVLCFALLIFGWFWLPEQNYKLLATHVVNTLFFISNIKFWRESGYFDASSHEKWLLHTWSLSVEWQFYIILPIIIFVLWKFINYKAVKFALFALGFLSLCLSIYASQRWPSAAFYLLPTRMWEMLAGGMAWWVTRRKAMPDTLARYTEVIGIVFISASIVLFNSSIVWPGSNALLPVAGAVLVLISARQKSIFTANIIAQKLGASSYSIYLWHWPIVVALTYLSLLSNYKWVLLALVATVILGELSLKLVENPSRKVFAKLSATSNLVYISLCTLVVGVLALTVRHSTLERDIMADKETVELYAKIQSFHVMPNRDNGYCFYNVDGESNPIISMEKSVCKLGVKSLKPKGLLFGDSFAGHYEPFVDEVAKKLGISVDSVTTNWCFPSLTDSTNGTKTRVAYKQCLLNREYLKDNISKYDFVIFSGIWFDLYRKGYQNEIVDVIKYAKSKGVKVYVMASPTQYDINVFANFIAAGVNDLPFRLKGNSNKKDDDTQKMDIIFSQLEKDGYIKFIKKDDIFDESDSYHYNGIEIPYSLDGAHISIDSSLMAAKRFIETGIYKKYFSDVK